ncbi:hypothetical protein D3X34_13670, partial [Acinetobacter baumannii]
MASLNSEFQIPLKVVTTRLNHMKINLPQLVKKIEKRAIENLKRRKDKKEQIDLLITWDDWIYAALDADHERIHGSADPHPLPPTFKNNMV